MAESPPLTETEAGRVIAPVDGSENSFRSAKEAIALAKQTNKIVVALFVVDTPRLTSTIPPDQVSTFWSQILGKQGEQVLEQIEKIGRDEGVTIEKRLIVGYPEDEILKVAGKNDIIVMGCKGRTALNRIFLGSVCETVIHHSTTPVMVVH
jgi:nucleotide-binding universal stress UspA family protein